MTGVRKRKVSCPDCGYTRNVFADSETVRCRSCADKVRRNGQNVECPGCGTEHYLSPHAIERGIRYCSIGCANEHMTRAHTPATKAKLSAGRRGKRNPNYKHGKRSEATGTPSNRQWKLSRKGEEDCRNCGQPAVHLHHIVPRSQTKRGLYDIKRNGLPLCAACHHGWHRRSLKIHRDILTDVEEAFALGCAGEGWLDLWYPAREEAEVAA